MTPAANVKELSFPEAFKRIEAQLLKDFSLPRSIWGGKDDIFRELKSKARRSGKGHWKVNEQDLLEVRFWAGLKWLERLKRLS